MRERIKGLIESVITASGVPSLARRARRADTIVLAYHGIVPDGETVSGDRSLHLARGEFARQLDLLARTHEVVSLADMTTPETRDRPRAVITFDDAYRGALVAGLPELVARGLPATIFVAPAFVGDHDFWWDVLAGSEGLSAAARSHALETLAGQDGPVREWAGRQGIALRRPPAWQRCATEEELVRAAALPGITLGSHAWAHPNLSRLPEPEAERELATSLAWLRERYENVVPWLAYPYGFSSPAIEAMLERLGYAGAVRVEGGFTRTGTSRYRIPRLNIPAGVSLRGFELRISGMMG